MDAEGSYSVLSDRAVIPPFGVLGGGSGAPYIVSVVRDGEETGFETPGKVTDHPVRFDDKVVMRSAGGGGYGDPLTRDPARVRADVLDGFVSRERAAAGYGVVLDDDDEVDLPATEAKRAEMAAARYRVRVVADDALDPYVGARGRRRTVELSPVMAALLGVADDDLVEMIGRHPAPLRAWVVIAPDHPEDTIRVDDFGRKVLGVADGDETVLRAVPTPKVPKGLAH